MKKFISICLILIIGLTAVSCSKKEEQNTADTSIEAKPYIDVVATYDDVNAGDWYEKSVSWGVNENIMAPAKPNSFGVNNVMSKADVILTMWKAAGAPGQVISAKTISDEDPNSDINKALDWAVNRGIISSSDKALLKNDASRLEAIDYFWKGALKPTSNKDDNFDDTPGIDSVAWAKQSGISIGVGHNLFAPDMDCTKAHMITFLFRAK